VSKVPNCGDMGEITPVTEIVERLSDCEIVTEAKNVIIKKEKISCWSGITHARKPVRSLTSLNRGPYSHVHGACPGTSKG
jgi:hypothetical protein